MHADSRFFRVFLLTALIAITIVVTINLIVDPYQIGGRWSLPSLSEARSQGINNAQALKIAAIKRDRPNVLILGTSRTDIGINARHPALTEIGRAYNAALPSADMVMLETVFQHALAVRPDLKMVVVGLDLVAFWPVPANRPVDERLARYVNAPSVDLIDLDTAFSSQALLSSGKTVLDWIRKVQPLESYREDGRLVRHNPPGVGTDEALRRHLQKVYLAPSGWYDAQHHVDARQMEALKRIVDLCGQRGIELKLFISPSHVFQWLALRESGLQPEFDAWKREIVQIAPVWDFSGANAITTEPVGPHMRRYLEGSHYLPDVGNLVLDRMFGRHADELPAGFGVLVDKTNIEAHLIEQRAALEQWIRLNPQATEFVAGLRSGKAQTSK